MPDSLPRWVLTGLVAALVLAQASSCCCCLGGAVTPPTTPFPIEKEQAAALRERVTQAKARTGPFEISITDQELTSYLVGLTQSGAGEFPAQDMKIEFGDGYVEICATFIEVAPSDLPVYVRATIEAVDGEFVFYIVQASAGPFPAPGAMRETISQSLGETLVEAMADLQIGLKIERVEISPGEMTISGQVTGDIPDLPVNVVN